MIWRHFPIALTAVLLAACNLLKPAPPPQPANLSPTGTSGPALTAPAPTATPRPPSPSPTPAATPTLPFAPPPIALEAAFTGFHSPVYITHAGEASRLFVVEKAGLIWLIENGVVQRPPFLDIFIRVRSSGNEQGLLSVAFPPDYAASGLFYVDYIDLNGNIVIARYRRSAGNPRQADPTSEQKILQIDQPTEDRTGDRNGGQLQFGPDGCLYIGTGNGGWVGERRGSAQSPEDLLGKILRIDVGETDTYTIPADNPFVSQAKARPEIWALGLHNPRHFSFDRATGDLYIADTGGNLHEEVDFQPAHSPGGQNYGWSRLEGDHCYRPNTGCDSSGTVLPVALYDHMPSSDCSIIGGYVYRGTRFPQMAGVYFFADFCSSKVRGLWRSESGVWQMGSLLFSNLSPISFGEDAAGELYLADYMQGVIYHLTAAP